MHRWRIGSAIDVVLTIRAEWDRIAQATQIIGRPTAAMWTSGIRM